MFNPNKFLIAHLLLPIVALVVVSIVITAVDLDWTIADFFYLL